MSSPTLNVLMYLLHLWPGQASGAAQHFSAQCRWLKRVFDLLGSVLDFDQ
jgi:hypothetical protein